MASSNRLDPTIARMRAHLNAGEMDGLREALLTLSPQGRDELRLRLGSPAVDRLLLGVRGARRAARGRVVVIHGIMGGKLASVDETGDDDLVWVNYFRLMDGRIGDFRLDAQGNQADPSISVTSCGLLDEYLPLVVELGREWEVLPFAYDWRLDIDQSVHKLNDAIRAWAGGKPVHIVAHSMGGLVSRRFIQLHPDTWDAMADPDGLKRGGRLVMLGTPNRGSFAIPFVLTGQEQTVRMLERLDFTHDLEELLQIIDTFVGSYQMMPSPKLEFGDDRLKLYEEKTWGTYPVDQVNLDRGRLFQEGIDEVIDADRLLYVAGFDQPTPYRVRVDGPGRLSYRETLAGDGRVPHELGLLPGVTSFYVAEKHGDLPSNEKVLNAIHELLRTGTTGILETQVHASIRGMRSLGWRKASEIAPIPPAINALLGSGAMSRGLSRLSPENRVLIESALVESYVGAKRDAAEIPTASRQRPSAAKARKSRKAAKTAPAHEISVEVMWGDICRADGDVYVAGHYQGWEPQYGELALDEMVSGISAEQARRSGTELVITSLTRRGLLRGAVGDIDLYPWAGTQKKITAIAGMGHPGTFGTPELRRLARSLTETLTVIPDIETVNTLLIGSGTGNLRVAPALKALLEGVVEALSGGAVSRTLRRIRIVERECKQARMIYRALKRLDVAAAGLQVRSGIVTGNGGVMSTDFALSAVVAAVASGLAAPARSSRAKAARALLRGIPVEVGLRKNSEKALAKVRDDQAHNLLEAAENLNLQRRPDESGLPQPASAATRVSFIHDERGARVAAITDTAVVPERFVAFDWALVNELIGKMTDPTNVTDIPDLASLLAGFVVPRDFRERIRESSTMIFEVDRETARIHWEMLGRLGTGADGATSIALNGSFARQLRTAYSPSPARDAPRGANLRALVIGDPGDPDKGYSLSGARREAIEVEKLLREHGVEVVALIGSPSAPRVGDLVRYKPATILEVLRLLQTQRFDLLHYAGHGDFDPREPERAGWIFGTRFFTSRELACVDKVPSVVVANACLSALAAPNENLLPGLADEFFKRGVRNYIGTAWPVNDVGAVTFSRVLYETMLAPNGKVQDTLGNALLKARLSLKAQDATFGALWAAYQHYGDPSFLLGG